MRKYLVLALLGLMLVSCNQETTGKLATVSFKSKLKSPTLSAYIQYIDADSLLWEITLTKTDSGEREGEGTYTDRLLTDDITGLSVGSWSFSLTGRQDGKIIYTGALETTLNEGLNSIQIPIEPSGNKGSLCFVNCNFDGTGVTNYTVTDDGQTSFSVSLSDCNYEDGLYILPETTKKVNTGIHDMVISYGSHTKSFKVRIVANQTTYITYGVHEGSMALTVLLNQEDALVE